MTYLVVVFIVTALLAGVPIGFILGKRASTWCLACGGSTTVPAANAGVGDDPPPAARWQAFRANGGRH